MQTSCKLSNVAKNYLNTFHCILDEMIREMTSSELGCSISGIFIKQMIPHHMGAIEMSNTTLQYDICPQLKPILDTIVSTQQKNICQMRQLLHQPGCM